MAYGSVFRAPGTQSSARQEAARRMRQEQDKARRAGEAGEMKVGGTLLGAGIGAALAPFTGGASLAAIPGFMATGASIGGALGGLGAAAVSPETEDLSKTLPGGLSALDRLLNLGEQGEDDGKATGKPKKKGGGPLDFTFGP